MKLFSQKEESKIMAIKPNVLTEIEIPGLTLHRKGKVRNVYDLDEKLLIVTSDRVSAFDYVLPDGIPHKGRVLTQLSSYWFDYTKDIVQNHIISTDVTEFPDNLKPFSSMLEGRSMYVKKTKLIEIECVVRAYLEGSGWKEYQQSQTVCQQPLPKGLKRASKLPELLFTPASKSHDGHDENISIEKMESIIGADLTQQLKTISFKLFTKVSAHCEKKGIILADTKFEFGLLDGKIVLIDEIFTPDSSRFWPADDYVEGVSPPSYDKQIIRNHLENSEWDKQPPVPRLPHSIIEKTSEKYIEIEKKLLSHD